VIIIERRRNDGAAANAPVNMMVSGPSGGVVAAGTWCGFDRSAGHDYWAALTDVRPSPAAARAHHGVQIEWVPIQIPMIDIRTIGAGGA
jgi:N-methylhydantoinase A